MAKSAAAGRWRWNLLQAVYSGASFSVGTQDGIAMGVDFKTDGTKMYVVGAGNRNVYQYSLSTAWDVSTASYDSVSFSVALQETAARDLTFKTDGTKMYVVGTTTDTVFQYSLSTAWDLSTASYDGVSFSVAALDNDPTGIAFKTDGTKMYVAGQQNQKVYQFSLGTAWDLATASSDSVSLTNADIVLDGVAFNNDGTKIFLVAFNDQKIYQYSLSAWNLATATYDNIAFSVSAQESWPRGIRFSSDGARAYVVGNFTDTVYQYRC